MKRLTNIFKVLLSVCMVFVLLPVINVSATDVEAMIDKELENAIISGDGSAENPYKVDYEKAPHFKAYMDEINEKVMLGLQGGNDSGVVPYGIFDGILVGAKHENQNKGGYWKFGSGAPNVGANGNIWMRAVTYSSKEDTVENYNTRNNSYYWNRISAIADEIATSSYSNAYNLIVSSGIAGVSATALLRAIGKANSVFAAFTILSFLNDYLVLSKYRSAVNNEYGMIHAVYNTSYQGQWYSQEAEDTWTTANTVYEPASYYGRGSYSSF